MPTARRSRTIAASADELWGVLSDPHHLPRWWPRVTRVEDVEDGAFTEVMTTSKGKVVRADFDLLEADEQERSLRWSQRVEGTPFARLLKSAETEVRLAPASDGQDLPAGQEGFGAPATVVTIELRQALTGFFPRFGGFMVRRAAAATIDEALNGLERISG
ncbi:MAG: Polyketide cyclase/dehydrase [Solirubrobacterales bacterium]|nr:Polyketide cyclase/dehydrase [Solirubrobacterales bacterium]